MSTWRRFSTEFKAKVALEALRGEKTIQEIAARRKVHPNQVSAWKQRAVAGMKEVFSNGAPRARQQLGGDPGPACQDRGTHGGAGFLSTRAQAMSLRERRTHIDRGHPKLSLSRQCRLLRVSRSSLYHKPRGEREDNWALMRRLVELFMAYPFYGSRQMVRHLRREGLCVGRHRVRRLLMRLMGLEVIYQAPRTSRPHPAHRVYPYVLKGVATERPLPPDADWNGYS